MCAIQRNNIPNQQANQAPQPPQIPIPFSNSIVDRRADHRPYFPVVHWRGGYSLLLPRCCLGDRRDADE